MKVGNAVELFLEDLKVHANTVVKYAERLRLFLLLFGEKEVCQLSRDTLKAYEDQLKAKKLSTNTRYMYLDGVKKFLGFLYAKDFLFINLAEGLSLPKWERKAKRVWSVDEFKKVAEKLKCKEPIRSRNRVIMALGCLENMKAGEIAILTVLDVDLSGKTIRLVRQKKFRIMNPLTAEYLKRYFQYRPMLKPKTDYVGLSVNGNPLQSHEIGKILHAKI